MPKHVENKVVPFGQAQMFDLVADVGKYPQFLRWCVGARVRTRTETELVASFVGKFTELEVE
jgi:coenzyme Q-binding protein COQ10